MNATQRLDSSLTSARTDRFRVVDVGRWLWLMTAAVLVLGFIAVRELSGVGDGPKIEEREGALIETVEQPREAPANDGVHTLVPITSQEPFSAIGDHSALPVGRGDTLQHEVWPPLPLPREAVGETPVLK